MRYKVFVYVRFYDRDIYLGSFPHGGDVPVKVVDEHTRTDIEVRVLPVDENGAF